MKEHLLHKLCLNKVCLFNLLINFRPLKFSFLSLVFISLFASAHGGDKAVTNEWQNLTLIAKAYDNWATEHCVDILEEYKLEYSFKAESSMMYDFHVHPNNEKNEYQTDYFSKSDSIEEENGEITTKKPGTYCFNFFPVQKTNENINISLKYRLSAAPD
ncbi:hypothetical protein ACPUVO_00085 [Pseudocolwellia sp. HL-MZ19]|uniref:hypothetical protein n=1 Tax=unclassified Pseudocolwellia TaxID=2848178 RepID=UPI003CF6536E